MKVAITRGYDIINKKILTLLKEKYGFKIINIDSMLFDFLEKKVITTNNYFEYNNQMLNFYKKVSDLLKSEFYINEDIAVAFSLLEDMDIYEYFDIRIKLNCKDNILSKNKYYDLYREYKFNYIDYLNPKPCNLTLNDTNNIYNDIDEYMNNFVFCKDKISVIVPIHNTEHYIFRIVNSVINQTYRNLEIILIDDGSTDNSLEVCKFLASIDARIKVIHQENLGLAKARNNGIKIATGKYISFLDADDYIELNMYEELIKKAKEKNADVCQGGFWIHMKDGSVKDVTTEQNGLDFFSGKKKLLEAHANHLISIAVWDKIYKTNAIKNIEFDGKAPKEDADYIFRLCNAGKTFAVVNRPFYHYVKRQDSSITSNKISLKLFSLQEWGHSAYKEILSNGIEYQDSADKILFNSLVHIIRNYIRDLKSDKLKKGEFQNEIQSVVNDLIYLLLNSTNVAKYRKLSEVLNIINELLDKKIVDREKFPSINIPCVGILWNSLDENMLKEAIEYISVKANIREKVEVDLKKCIMILLKRFILILINLWEFQQ